MDTELKTRVDAEVKDVLRNVDLFEAVDDDHLLAMAAAGDVLVLERGQMLFRQGDRSDRLFLVMEGAIEIVRATSDQSGPVPVAYIAPGELIGEMALFTGTPRRSDARIPEIAVVWVLTKRNFMQLADRIPGYGMELTKMFALRTQELITHMQRQTKRKELTGKLRHFDMPTVVQTLISAKQNGLLSFMDNEEKTFAEVVMTNGNIDRAWCGPLHGDEAFSEIFLHRNEGEFIFRSSSDFDPDIISGVAIDMPAHHLLMETMRKADELEKLREEFPDTNRSFEALTTALVWKEEDDREVAQAVLRLLRSPRPIEGLNDLVPCSTYMLYRVMQKLVASRQVGPV